MDIRCERCLTEYELEDETVSEVGTSVQCTTCGHTFEARRPPRPVAIGGPADKPLTFAAPALEWVVETASGEVHRFAELTVLHRLIVERKVTRKARISRPGQPWRLLEQLGELTPFFDVVDQADRARALATPPPATVAPPPPRPPMVLPVPVRGATPAPVPMRGPAGGMPMPGATPAPVVVRGETGGLPLAGGAPGPVVARGGPGSLPMPGSTPGPVVARGVGGLPLAGHTPGPVVARGGTGGLPLAGGTPGPVVARGGAGSLPLPGSTPALARGGTAALPARGGSAAAPVRGGSAAPAAIGGSHTGHTARRPARVPAALPELAVPEGESETTVVRFRSGFPRLLVTAGVAGAVAYFGITHLPPVEREPVPPLAIPGAVQGASWAPLPPMPEPESAGGIARGPGDPPGAAAGAGDPSAAAAGAAVPGGDPSAAARGGAGDPSATKAAAARGGAGDPSATKATAARGAVGDPSATGVAAARGGAGDPSATGVGASRGGAGDPPAAGAAAARGAPGDPSGALSATALPSAGSSAGASAGSSAGASAEAPPPAPVPPSALPPAPAPVPPPTTPPAPPSAPAMPATPPPPPASSPPSTAEAPAAPGTAPGATPGYGQLVAEGYRLQQAGAITRARKLYEAALEQRPDGVEALTGMGYVQLDRNRFSAAITYFRRALAVSLYPPAMFGIGEAYRYAGEASRAVDAYRRFVAEAPHDRDAPIARRQIRALTPSPARAEGPSSRADGEVAPASSILQESAQ